MKTNTLKSEPTNSGDSEHLKQLPEAKSNPDSNPHFWHLLGEAVNTKKERRSIKGRIFTAKRILTPVIQDLMRDALQQIETDNREAPESAREVQVLYNNIIAKNVFAQKDYSNGGKDWAVSLLSEISRDLEQPFEKLHENEDEHVERSATNVFLNNKLLSKLELIHQHLGNIIDRLREECKVEKTETEGSMRKMKEHTFKSYNVNSLQLGQPNGGPLLPANSTYEGRSISHGKDEVMKSEIICLPAALVNEENEQGCFHNEHQYDVNVCAHSLFEEKRNEAGNRQVVIKCLEDLERVRTYLEALRDKNDCEKPKFNDLESCKNGSCNESQPHLHSILHNAPIVLKLNKHAEDNERNSDLIIGIPSLTSSYPDVQILLNSGDHRIDISPFSLYDSENREKFYRIRRTPKLTEKKPYESPLKYSSEKLLNEQGSSCIKATNLLIFDPDDPCNSIIKMKEHKNLQLYGQRCIVSKNTFPLMLMSFLLKFFYIGGISRYLIVGFELHLFVAKQHPVEFFHLRLTYRFVSIFFSKNPLPVDKPLLDCCAIPKVSKQSCLLVGEYDFIISKEKRYMDCYVKHILNFISIMKGTTKNHSKLVEKTVPKKTIFDCIQPSFHAVYFFECMKENKKKVKADNSSDKGWNIPPQEPEAYPLWTIKRSKYYSVPQSKKNVEMVNVKQIEEKHNSSEMDQDSLEVLGEPHKEIHVQVSKISISINAKVTGELMNADGEKPAKAEIKRKVSFRDDVNDPKCDPEPEQPKEHNIESSECQNTPRQECNESYFEDIEYDPEKVPSIEDDFKEINTRISDMLMTVSLMKITEELTRESSKNKTLENLNFTDSARKILAKLSKSFEKEKLPRNSSKVNEETVKQFYDKDGNLITEICDSEGDLLFKLKNNNAHKLIPVLFDSRGSIEKNIYDADGEHIKAVYDGDGKVIRKISQVSDGTESDREGFETVEYLNVKSDSIKSIFEPSGDEKFTDERNASTIFDAGGGFLRDSHTERRDIEEVYDTLGSGSDSPSVTALETSLRNEQVRMVKMGADSNKKIGNVSKSVNFENDDFSKKDSSPKKFFDKDGNLLTGVYDRKGKPIKITSSGEADELLPFLFNEKGKLQKKRYDSRGKELKAVFGEDGSAISETSIAWLNELLANSTPNKSNTKARDKKKSIFRRITKPKTKTKRELNIEKLYDSDGKMVTSVFDSKGKLLVESPSGDVNKLIPFLFDNGGRFMKKRFDCQKHKIRRVYGDDGNAINNISVSYLNQILEKLVRNQNLSKAKDGKKDLNAHENSKKLSEKSIEHAESNKMIDLFDRVPDDLFDKDGNILKEVFDRDGNVLATSSSGNVWRLLPYLFDAQGLFLKNRYDQKGRELVAVYNKAGENMNNYLSAAIKTTMDKAKLYGKNKIDVHKKDEKMEETMSTSISSKKGYNEKIEKNSTNSNEEDITAQKKKLDNRELKPILSIMNKESISKLLGMSKLILRKGSSIYKFYDDRGNPITEVYDSKGRNLIRTKSDDVEELAKFLFTEEGFLADNIHDRKGRKITRIFDHTKKSISRISISSIVSEENTSKTQPKKEQIPGRVYDTNGKLVKEIYDSRGSPVFIEKLAKFGDLAPVIFDEKGVRRRLFDKSGNEIGPLFDHKGNILKFSNISDKQKSIDTRRTRIFSKSGEQLLNFYDSMGAPITALYDESEKLLCRVEKGINNADKLAKFFFDKDGHFIRRFYNSKGQLIKHVYDSEGNLIRSIERADSKSAPRRRSQQVVVDQDFEGKYNENMKIYSRDKADHIRRGQHEKDGKKKTEHLRHLASQSDTIMNSSSPIIQRSISAYSLRDYPKRKEIETLSDDISNQSLIKTTIKKFYDEKGRLLTGVYNSKTRLLGYSESGNARVLTPYLFDLDGNFIPGRYSLHRKPLKNIYDSEGFLVEKISKPDLKERKSAKKGSDKSKRFKIHDKNGDVITSVYDFEGDKIFDVKDHRDKISVLFDNSGKLKKNLYNCRGSKLRIYNVKQESVASEIENDETRVDEVKDSKRLFSIMTNLRDKILTVVFDNQHRKTEEFSVKLSGGKRDSNLKHDSNRKSDVKKRKNNCLYDNTSEIVTDLYDDRGKKIRKVFDSDGKVIDELYSVSGTLIKNNVLKNMFEDNVFKPKVYNSRGNLITAVYSNKKRLMDVYDGNGMPAAVDSDLVYLVSKQSLPADLNGDLRRKQSNLFSEERGNQIGQVKNEPFTTLDFNYENEMKIAFNRYTRRTEHCVCENCLGRNRNNTQIVQFGGEMFHKLSRLTIPLSKLLLPGFCRRQSEEMEEVDSLETLIDQSEQDSSRENVESDKEYYSRSSGSISVLYEREENVLISRKMIEKTLRNCVHFNSSTEVIGNVSDTVLQHYVTLILREIENKFYRKLEVLNCRGSRTVNSTNVFQRDFERDICIGTELKFEDSSIGRHSLAQTSSFFISQDNHDIRQNSSNCFSQTVDLYRYINGKSEEKDYRNEVAFVCKVPNLQPFLVMMKTNVKLKNESQQAIE